MHFHSLSLSLSVTHTHAHTHMHSCNCTVLSAPLLALQLRYLMIEDYWKVAFIDIGIFSTHSRMGFLSGLANGILWETEIYSIQPLLSVCVWLDAIITQKRKRCDACKFKRSEKAALARLESGTDLEILETSKNVSQGVAYFKCSCFLLPILTYCLITFTKTIIWL